MSRVRMIPADVVAVQRAASDPQVSAWVGANAGAGKTHVLAQRVINLLLAGTDPAKILCITFTKAAAANMANRVFETLARWVTLDDTALDQEIRTIADIVANAAIRAHARRLFAATLETPGGLKVQTIHAFCTRLLHQFPFEANVAARFTVLDEATTAKLLERLTLDVLLQAAAAPQSALGRALEQAIIAAADQTLKDVINEAIGQRERLSAWISRAGDIEKAVAELTVSLGLKPDDSDTAAREAFFAESLIPESDWPDLIAVLKTGLKTDAKHAGVLTSLRGLAGDAKSDAYLQIFCTAKLEPRQNLLTKKLGEAYPEWLDRLQAEQTRLCTLIARRRAIATRDRTAALMIIANEVIERYRAEKDRRGLLDYEDLIDKTLALFESASAAWVLYKLDLGVDHMLIDEAQDTSPRQWEIIKHIGAEFTAGAGARGMVKRTIFAVGDEKQSIFSFQGAAPDTFATMRTHFKRLHVGGQTEFIEREFKTSFRSGPVVLEAVDEVFKRPQAYDGLTAVAGATVHRALPGAVPGVVELWEPVAPDARRLDSGWSAPFDTVTADSPPARLAAKIAATIRKHCQDGGRAGDVLILVRRRGVLFETVIRALKEAGIAVAGADRLVLTEHIAVMDLMVLADALLLPDDDLAVATVLKSPLFGLADDDLLALAWQRPGSLLASLRDKAKDNLHFAATVARFDRLAVAARQMLPFTFYARVLGAEGGRRSMLARLGIEAMDALDEFLNLALDYEARETPSLQGFVAWLRAAQTDVKRDMEMGRDEVRVMTVHGAKGLEAPFVILADTIGRPRGPKDPRLLGLPQGGFVWAAAQNNDTDLMAQARTAAREAAEREYRRLLYVALTRAERRLIVCGVDGKQNRPEGCWYDLVAAALTPLCIEEPADDGEGRVWRFSKEAPERDTPGIQVALPAAPKPVPPEWLWQSAVAEPPAVRLVSPSDSDDDDARPHRQADQAAARFARRRGTVIHRLLQSLPGLPVDRREAAAHAYLARAGRDWTHEWTDEQRAAVLQPVLTILTDARFAPLFAPGSRAEVPIVGNLPGIRVNGQIDRLAVTGTQVLIADYKTGRPRPEPAAYVRQLALYRAVLARLYPRHTIRAALIWTDVPDLAEISDATMDAALVRALAFTAA